MSMNCGIIGLPNVGKSTLFSALTAKSVPMENYPFCTIEPNKGIVHVADNRLNRLAEILKPEETIPAVVEFVDIAGLVEGASRGEGLGNQFLAQIREVGVIVHVVRCFVDDDVAHVTGTVDPVSDIEIVNTELALADLDTVEKRMEKNEKQLKSDNKEVAKEAREAAPVLENLALALGQATPARKMEFSIEEAAIVENLHLLTMKPQLFVCNVDEEGLAKESELVGAVERYADGENAACLPLCCKLESEIAALEDEDERAVFLADAGLEISGLEKLVHSGYSMLGLRTFFTENGREARAWTFHVGDKAPAAAGTIHTDFEKGFIKAEVYQCEDLFTLGSVHHIKEAGKLRIEGKDYEVRDGDVILFRFNVV